MTAATKTAFEKMAEVGGGDAGALALGLRRGVTSVGLRVLAAKMLHAAAAAPERMMDIHENAAAGWLSLPVFPPRLRSEAPLPISASFWSAFWDVVNLSPTEAPDVAPVAMLRLAGRLDPRLDARMAAVARDLPGIARAAGGGLPEPLDVERLDQSHPASLGFLLRDEIAGRGGVVQPFGHDLVPQLRRMPPPLDYINIQIFQSLPVLALVAGYNSRVPLDQMGLSGFLMAQAAHHYSALATAVAVAGLSDRRPPGLELALDSLFKGWVHGRTTPLLIGAPWDELLELRIDQAREVLGVTPFESPYLAAVRRLRGGTTRH